MMIIATIVYILLSTYVGASDIKDDSKTGYFVASGIIFAALLIGSLLLGNGGNAQ